MNEATILLLKYTLTCLVLFLYGALMTGYFLDVLSSRISLYFHTYLTAICGILLVTFSIFTIWSF